MKHKKKNPGAVPTARGVGIDAHKGGAVPNKLTTPSHAAQRARGTTEDAVVRPRQLRRLLRLLDGRLRLVIRGKRKSDPVVVLTVDDGGQQR